MFSPGIKRPSTSSLKDSPVTPTEAARSVYGNSIPSRPATGTPAPWISRPSLTASEGSAQEINTVPKRATFETLDTLDGQGAASTGIVQRTAQDEESESLLGHFFHDFLAYGHVIGSLEKLRNANAFGREGEENAFSRASKSIIDALAKHWSSARGAEIVATTVVATQLMDKKLKHEKFLQFLALSKCYEELCDRAEHALQIIMEHGEKLAGMIQLRELQKGTSQGCSTENTSSLWDLINLVGDRARRNVVILMDRDNAEVFYSKVSNLEDFFYGLAQHLEYIIHAEQPILVQLQRACELSNACVALIQTARQYKNDHQMWYPSPVGLTPWYCQSVVRNGLWRLSSLIQQLLNERTGLDVSAKLEMYPQFAVLVEVLLEVYAGAISSKFEHEEMHKNLMEEYRSRKDTLLECLYRQITGFAQAGPEGLHKDDEDQSELMFKKLSSHLMSVAKQHGGYQTLWHICCDVNDLGLLRNLMEESMGPAGGFSHFVFRQLLEAKQLTKLLRLGEDFPEELSTFLKQHPDLLWLHQVFLNQFPAASETLHTLALSQNEISFSERKHFLNISKIAAMAGKDGDHETKIKRIEADTKFLQLQDTIADEEKHQLLPPAE